VNKMLSVRTDLLQKYYPNLDPKSPRIRSGFHRGERGMFTSAEDAYFKLPDAISVKHLHLHVIVDLYGGNVMLKYPLWLPWVFISPEAVVKRLKQLPFERGPEEILREPHEEL